jgi:hypothetical protein
MRLGGLSLAGIPQVVVWFTASYVSTATVYVIWKVFNRFLCGFPAGHVSWGSLPVIWMVCCWLFYFVYLFIVFWILSLGFPYPTCVSYLFNINLIPLLSNSCESLPVASEADRVEIWVWRSLLNLSSGIQVGKIWIKVFIQQKESYGNPDQTLRPAGTMFGRSKCCFSGTYVMVICITVFVQQEQCYGDLDESLRPMWKIFAAI